jgi:hypothetical protein
MANEMELLLLNKSKESMIYIYNGYFSTDYRNVHV